MKHQFLLYGAYGYTGKLIAEMATSTGLTPVLAGRSEAKVAALADELGYPSRIFPLDDPARLDEALRPFSVVLHAAGPFKHTAAPMMDACIRTQTHYLDITGEIEAFELGKRHDMAAKAANIMIMPGTGFDVVPTDCLAAYLHRQLPDATHLRLAFSMEGGGVSHGTAITMAENLGEGGAVRQDGRIVRVPLGHKTMWVNFGSKKRFVMAIPWGDVSTAYHSTGIPNIEVYSGISPRSYRYVRWQKYLGWLLRMNWVRSLIKRRISRKPAGPGAGRRAKARGLVWGQVSDQQGNAREARLDIPEGYTLTAMCSLIIVQKVLNGQWTAGFQTPSSAYGPDLILEAEGAERTDLETSAVLTKA